MMPSCQTTCLSASQICTQRKQHALLAIVFAGHSLIAFDRCWRVQTTQSQFGFRFSLSREQTLQKCTPPLDTDIRHHGAFTVVHLT